MTFKQMTVEKYNSLKPDYLKVELLDFKNNMTDKEIVQEMEGGNTRIELCDIEEYIHMLLGQYQANPIQLKKIIGGKLFNEIKFRYNRK